MGKGGEMTMKLVLLHGLGQTNGSWKESISNLPKEWEIDTPKLFEKDELITYEQLYKAFVKECEKYTEPFHLGGISLGGMLACQYAIQYPKKVKSLLLIAVQLKPNRSLLKIQQLLFYMLPKFYFRLHV